ncbi:hypothetical protein [Campylobacter sp. 19-13652]|uniref:hypothetical protein n=1 Tax=Campylobacter sp. 19-13652 TaxID=2840180 RepID=UPI001C76A3B5|nr:hypothetical protein [Campylobacter sp. 19-13652]BCX80114.1 hypothetical protein LBC_15760 [Campylobacter sp. 19-13652]
MNNFETLRELGVKEVARKTHIEPQIISLILEKNYDALAKYNVCGHIKIITREFDVDMSEWLSEYAAAVPYSQGVKSCGAIDKIPPFTDSAERDVKPAGRGLMWFGFLIFVAAIFVYFFSEHIGLDKFIQDMQEKKTQVVSPNLEQVEQAKRNLNEANEEPKPSAGEGIQSQSIDDSSALALQEAQEKVSASDEGAQNQEAQAKEPADKTQDATPNTQDIVPAKSDTQALQDSPKKVQTASLKTLKKVWVGIINLKTKSKKSYDAAAGREFVIDLSQTQLIVAGNGGVNLITDGKKQSFNPSGAVRLLVKDGAIKQISYDEFVTLNGGKSW